MDFTVFESVPVGICLIDADYRIHYWNICLQDWTGLNRKEAENRDLREIYPTLQQEIYRSRLGLIFDGGPPAIFSAQLHRGLFEAIHPDLPQLSLRTTVSSVHDEERGPMALFAVENLSAEIKRSEELRRLNRIAAEEIEQRRRAEAKLQKTLEENTILLREHHHRTKNNFGMLLSLLELQKETLFDPRDEEIIEILTNRIFSIQRVHEHLAMNTDSVEIDLEEYIRDMALDLLGENGPGEPRLVIKSDPIRLNLAQAIPAGMILAELMTNSLKHAFRDGDRGTVMVEARRTRENLIRIRYSDSGPGRPHQNPNELGLGVRLNEAFAQQLQGSYRQDSGPGAPTLIEFPLPSPPTT